MMAEHREKLFRNLNFNALVPIRRFQSIKIDYASVKGFEIMCIFKKGQFNSWMYEMTFFAVFNGNYIFTLKKLKIRSKKYA